MLEVALLEAVKAAMHGDTYTATRILFRLKSESNRLEVADAIIRPQFTSQKLGGAWQEAYAAFKCCKNIRNTYAHSTWISDPQGVLRFGDLEKAANTKEGASTIRFRPLTRQVLEEQFAYFTHADHLILWATDQFQIATKQERKLSEEQFVTKPQRISPPRLDSREAAHSPQSN